MITMHSSVASKHILWNLRLAGFPSQLQRYTGRGIALEKAEISSGGGGGKSVRKYFTGQSLPSDAHLKTDGGTWRRTRSYSLGRRCEPKPVFSYSMFSTRSQNNVLASQYKAPELTPARLSPTGNRKRTDDPVSQRLLSAKTSHEIIDVIEYDAENMDHVAVCVAMDSLFDAIKTESLSEKAKHEMLTSVGVQKLCKLLRRKGPHMDPGDLINGVKLLSILAVPGSHQTFQILLKLISKHANSLDLQQLFYMQFLLDKLDARSKSPLSKALEIALPVVFEGQLSHQLDRNDPNAICDYLHYATRYRLSEKTVNGLVDAALRITDRIPVRLAVSLMWSLCDIRVDSPSHEPLVQWCFNRLSENMDSYKFNDINIVMSKATRKYCKRVPYFYNEQFVDTYCQMCIQKSTDVNEILWCSKYVSLLRHVNIELVDRIGEIIASKPSHILNSDTLFVMLVRSFSSYNYKPEKWPSFSSILLEHPALIKAYGVHDISLAIDFLALELFPETMIRVLYSADGLPLLEEFLDKYFPGPLVLLYNAVKVLHPNYNGPLPPITMIEAWKERSRAANVNKQYPLKSALRAGLGGDSYVINGLYQEGLYIDHGIVMRKGGFPVAVNSQSDSQSDCLSSIVKPPGSVLVLVKVFPNESYVNNTRRLRGIAALELRILESLGNPVVVVDQEKWMELLDHEKIPFLMQKIREKMEHLQWNQNWGDVIPP